MSKQKKTRNKKYNPRKSFELGIQAAVFIAFESEKEDGVRTCVTNIATPAIRDAVTNLKTDWLIQIGLIYQTKDSYDAKETYIIARGKRINDLNDDYAKERDQLLNNANPNLVVDFGWIIKPYSKRLERKVNEEREKTVLDYWLERKQRFERQTLEALQ